MGIDVKIKDGTGKSKQLRIDNSQSAYVTETKIPADNLDVVLRPFSEFLLNSSNSSDMRVNGATTNVDFYIQAPQDGDRYIQTLSITIADAGAQLNEFGNLVALTNGCQLIYEDDEVGDVILASSLKTNFDFIQLCNFEPTFGTGVDAFLASNVSGVSEAYIPILDVTDVFGLPYGLKLPKGTTKRLVLKIRDNVTTLDRFDVRVFGFDKVNRNEDN
jgi:hypothetical protein